MGNTGSLRPNPQEWNNKEIFIITFFALRLWECNSILKNGTTKKSALVY